jgi:hypothetical protein
MRKESRIVVLAVIAIALVLIIRTLQDKGEYVNDNPYALGTERFLAK